MTRLLSVGDAQRQQRLARIIADDYRFIWRLLRRLGVPLQGVDDATQQVFLIVAERLDDIQQNSERSFAFGTALRVAQSARRRHARELTHDDHDELAALAPSPEDLTSQRRAREKLDRLLDEIPLDLRTVFVLYELEGLTSPEIAELCSIPLGTVASRLRRARERFRELVAQTSTPPRAKRGES